MRSLSQLLPASTCTRIQTSCNVPRSVLRPREDVGHHLLHRLIDPVPAKVDPAQVQQRREVPAGAVEDFVRVRRLAVEQLVRHRQHLLRVPVAGLDARLARKGRQAGQEGVDTCLFVMRRSFVKANG